MQQLHIAQRSNVKMGVLLGKTQAQIHRELKQAFGEQRAFSKGRVHFWFHQYREDPEAPVTDKKRPGRQRHRQEKTDLVLDLLEEDRRMTLRQLTAGTGVPRTTVHRILRKDLEYRKIAPKMVPRVLTQEQMRARRSISQENLAKIRGDPDFFRKLITVDESWVFVYDPRTKLADCQWCSPVEPRPVKALRARSMKKTMLVLFFDDEGVVHSEFRDQGVGTINTATYIKILRRFRESVRRKRPHKWQGRQFTLLQDNAPAHTSVLAAEYFHKTQMELISHPPYSPDLAPCDYWAFPHLKNIVQGRRFESVDDLKIEISQALRAIPAAEFEEALKKLEMRYEKCVERNGGYFEGQGQRTWDPE